MEVRKERRLVETTLRRQRKRYTGQYSTVTLKQKGVSVCI